MKKMLFSVLMSMATLAAGADIHDYPDYICRSTSVITPTKVEITHDATKLSFHVDFIPGFWIMVDSTANIIDPASGRRFAPVSSEGLTLGEKFWMPESGESDFTMVFPSLPDGVDAIDFVDGNWKVVGLRLDGGKAEKPEMKNVAEWEKEHAVPYSGEPEDFFRSGDAILSGVISGYNPLMGFDSMLVYDQNSLTAESTPVSIPVEQDGSFKARIPMSIPGFVQFVGPCNVYTNIYLEPGRILEVLIDWNELLDYDAARRRDRSLDLPLHFGGELGEINREIKSSPYKEFAPSDVQKMGHDKVPSETSRIIDEWYGDIQGKVDSYIVSADINPVTAKILLASLKSQPVHDKLDYAMFRRDQLRRDSLAPSLAEPIDTAYFSFLKDFLADSDIWILATPAMTILPNRLAYMDLLPLLGAENCVVYRYIDPGFRFLRSKGVKFNPEEEKMAEEVETRAGTLAYIPYSQLSEFNSELRSVYQMVSDIAVRNGLEEELSNNNQAETMKEPDEVISEFPYNIKLQSDAIRQFAATDSVPLAWQITSCSYLCSYSGFKPKYLTKETFATIAEQIRQTNSITHPAVAAAFDNYVEKSLASMPYKIPDDERGRVIKDIIAPYKGKFVLIDFWGTGCGPCRANIESSAQMRERNRENPDFKMIFVTSDVESPRDAYDSYVAKNLSGETSVYLPQSDFIKLRDLFRFNGIPRYVLIDRAGRVVDDNFNFMLLRLKDTLKENGVTIL